MKLTKKQISIMERARKKWRSPGVMIAIGPHEGADVLKLSLAGYMALFPYEGQPLVFLTKAGRKALKDALGVSKI